MVLLGAALLKNADKFQRIPRLLKTVRKFKNPLHFFSDAGADFQVFIFLADSFLDLFHRFFQLFTVIFLFLFRIYLLYHDYLVHVIPDPDVSEFIYHSVPENTVEFELLVQLLEPPGTLVPQLENQHPVICVNRNPQALDLPFQLFARMEIPVQNLCNDIILELLL